MGGSRGLRVHHVTTSRDLPVMGARAHAHCMAVSKVYRSCHKLLQRRCADGVHTPCDRGGAGCGAGAAHGACNPMSVVHIMPHTCRMNKVTRPLICCSHFTTHTRCAGPTTDCTMPTVVRGLKFLAETEG